MGVKLDSVESRLQARLLQRKGTREKYCLGGMDQASGLQRRERGIPCRDYICDSVSLAWSNAAFQQKRIQFHTIILRKFSFRSGRKGNQHALSPCYSVPGTAQMLFVRHFSESTQNNSVEVAIIVPILLQGRQITCLWSQNYEMKYTFISMSDSKALNLSSIPRLFQR